DKPERSSAQNESLHVLDRRRARVHTTASTREQGACRM
ncbi:MAG: hypothetical protein AVDCRST_MAG90-584, partial [uncultured Microvirga sp.]